jgi:hypothetical protein
VLPPVFILTSFDGFKKESIWTNEKPTIQQLCRIVQVANHSLAALKKSIFNFQSTEEIKVCLIFVNFYIKFFNIFFYLRIYLDLIQAYLTLKFSLKFHFVLKHIKRLI